MSGIRSIALASVAIIALAVSSHAAAYDTVKPTTSDINCTSDDSCKLLATVRVPGVVISGITGTGFYGWNGASTCTPNSTTCIRPTGTTKAFELQGFAANGAPVLVGGALGTPSSGTLTNATGLPVSTGISGLGTGVATALGVNVGSPGAFVVNGGALGTPSSGDVSNTNAVTYASTMSSLQAMTASQMAAAKTVVLSGYYGTGTAGGATYTWLTANSLTADGGAIIKPSDDASCATHGCLVIQGPTISNLNYGAKQDGITIAALSAQKCILAAAVLGKRCYIAPKTVLSDATIDGNVTAALNGGLNVVVDGAVLAPKTGTAPTANPGLSISNVSGGRVEIIALDGNRSNQPADEYIFPLYISNSKYIVFPQVHMTESRGDCIYITDDGVTGANSSAYLTFGPWSCANSSVDGRQAISISSGHDISFGVGHSINVGGNINGTTEPGGVDLEPFRANQTIYNIAFAEIEAVCGTATSCPFGIVNSIGATIHDIKASWRATCTGAAATNCGVVSSANTITNVRIDGASNSSSNTGAGFSAANVSGLTGRLSQAGFGQCLTLTSIAAMDFTFNATNCGAQSGYSVWYESVTNSRLSGSVSLNTAVSENAGVRLRGTNSNDTTTLSFFGSPSGGFGYGVWWNNGATLSNFVVDGGDLATYDFATAFNGMSVSGVTLKNLTTSTLPTVTLNGATAVTVTDARVKANSKITFTLKTVGGTVGAYPTIKTITPGTGFTVSGTNLDTSVYNYTVE